MSQVIAKEARQLYSMIALLKCSQQIGTYLISTPYQSLHPQAKYEIKGLMNRVDLFQNALLKGISKQDREQWNKDFDRDYMAFSSVFELMSGMDDKQRERLELFATELSKEEVKTAE